MMPSNRIMNVDFGFYATDELNLLTTRNRINVAVYESIGGLLHDSLHRMNVLLVHLTPE